MNKPAAQTWLHKWVRAARGTCGSVRVSTRIGATPIRMRFLRDRCHEAPFLPHARYHFVSSTVTPTLLGLIAGDHLVRSKSAAGLGKSRRIPFEPEHGLTLTGLNHFDLLNHPLVYAKLHDWLVRSPVRSAGVSDTG